MDTGGRRHRRIRPELKVRGAKGAANEALKASIGSEYRVPSPADEEAWSQESAEQSPD